jgi:2,5-furandicarboxylate decarboxylase 1
MAYRYMPNHDTVWIDGCDTMTVDPKSTTLGIASKIALDCTVPTGLETITNEFVRSTIAEPGGRQDHDGSSADSRHGRLCRNGAALLVRDSEALSRPLYPVLHRAFGNPRHKLGQTNDPPWCRYSQSPLAYEAKPQMPNHSDPRHIKTTVP